MLNSGLEMDGVIHPWDELKSNKHIHPILLFCRQWLNGTDSFLFHSSGSTGKPKEIHLSRKQMENSASMTRQLLRVQNDDRLLLAMNPETVGGRMVLVRAMEWDLPVSVKSVSANPMLELAENHTFTITSLVPLQLIQILEDEASLNKLNRFKKILLGGAAIDQNLDTAIQKLKPEIFHTYGMTETCSHVAAKLLNGPNRQDKFYPLPGVKLGCNDEGALWIDSPTTSARPLQTNDLVQFEEDGGFNFLGRADRTINSGGIKIQLDEIEKLSEPILAGKQYYYDGLEDEKLGQKLCLIIEGDAFDTEELHHLLKKELPPYKAPKAIIFAPRFLLTKSGKIDRINTSLQWAKTN